MTMLADLLQRRTAPDPAKTASAARSELAGKAETVYVYDWNEVLQRGTAWMARVPVADLMDHLPVTCRHTPNLRALHWWSAAAGTLLGILAVSGAFYPLLWYYGAIMGFLLGAGPGFVIGWYLAPKMYWMPKPFWVVRRVWAQEGEDSELEDPNLFAQFNDKWRRYVIPCEFNFETDGAYVSGDGSGSDVSQSHALVSGVKQGGDGQGSNRAVFLPIVHRATSLYESLQMRVYKQLHKRSLTGWQKVQIASVAVLAGVALGALIFIVIVTSDEKEPVAEPAAAAASWMQGR